MSFPPEPTFLSWGGKPPDVPPAYQRGLAYLHQVQRLALAPGMVNGLEGVRDRIMIGSWIGENIHWVNAKLSDCLQACYECFYPEEHRTIQIVAAPLVPSYGLDGICNIRTSPITIVVDVGRIVPQDWLALVAHEYAHAHLGNSGHDATFATLLSHLCLGLGLEPPTWDVGMEIKLRHWPPCQATAEPLAFWRGQG